jgi:hypothetical protein
MMTLVAWEFEMKAIRYAWNKKFILNDTMRNDQ